MFVLKISKVECFSITLSSVAMIIDIKIKLEPACMHTEKLTKIDKIAQTLSRRMNEQN